MKEKTAIQHFHKLVRDRIPEIIREHGDECETETMNEQEYREALRQKIVEEAREVAEAGSEELTAELADMLEVIEALAGCYGLDMDKVQATRERKRSTNGGFNQRIRLLSTYRWQEQVGEQVE